MRHWWLMGARDAYMRHWWLMGAHDASLVGKGLSRTGGCLW